MKVALVAVALVLASSVALPARADLGWTRDQYEEKFGPGKQGFATVNEVSYQVGDSALGVEFDDANRSVAEIWGLGTIRNGVPADVLAAGEAGAEGREIERIKFGARASLPAEIREAVVGDAVVRVDVRNQLVVRIAFCGKKPSCGLWQRWFGPPCETSVPCPILDRTLSADRTLDDLHMRAERAVRRAASAHEHEEAATP
jgi:hypothetical protein